MDKLRWGILGTGVIATTMAELVARSPLNEAVAVGSRSQDRAEAFAAKHDVTRSYDDYAKVIEDDDVDLVYVALPTHLHARWSIRAAEAGKHLLCEKPMARDAAEAAEVLDVVKRKDVFFLEGFMYRFHGQTHKLVELIRDGAIGSLRAVHAAFNVPTVKEKPEDFRLKPENVGGGIMDVGAYPVSMARLLIGAALGKDFADPIDVQAFAHVGSTGVDEWSVASMRFEQDVMATATCALHGALADDLILYGDEGVIEVPTPWWPNTGAKIHLLRGGTHRTVIDTPDSPTPHAAQVESLPRYIADRQVPPPMMTWADSLGNMTTLDRWREAAGLL